MSVNSNICPNCEEMNGPVEFKTDLGEGDVMVCEDCYNDLEGWQEDTDDDDIEYCEKHEQSMYNDKGLKCGACCDEEDDADAAEDDADIE